MSFIKCYECKKEISDKAVYCPACGYPNQNKLNKTVENINVTKPVDEKPRTTYTLVLLFILCALLLLGTYLYKTNKLHYNANLISNLFKQETTQDTNQDIPKDANYQPAGTTHVKQSPTSVNYNFNTNTVNPNGATQQIDSSKLMALEKVNNLGYTFYVGQIDYPNTQNITDDIKNQITKVAYTAHFPVNLLKKIPIIILNSLALNGDQYIHLPDNSMNLKVIDLSGAFLSEEGLYARYGNSGVIYVNKTQISNLTEIITHELGHAIGDTLTDQEWNTFYQLRNIPVSTPRMSTNWNQSPTEDFAEVYRSVFTGSNTRTNYGTLISVGFDNNCRQLYSGNDTGTTEMSNIDIRDAMLGNMNEKLTADEEKMRTDPNVQNCRKELMQNPSKWPFGIGPYKYIVDQKTKDFINQIVNKLK